MLENKAIRIENLNRSLKPPEKLGGKFVPEEFEKQFDFMLVAEMPSMREPKDSKDLHTNYNFNGDKGLHKAMIECNVGGSYVTDIVKERRKPGRPVEEQIIKWLPFPLEEIKIINPKFIVVLGKGNYDINFQPFIISKLPKTVKVDWVFHYSTRSRRQKLMFEQRFREVINELRNSDRQVLGG